MSVRRLVDMGAHGISTISVAFQRTAAHLAYIVRVLKM